MANNYKQILKQKYLQAVKNLPQIIANEAENISNDAFKTSSWNGVSWPARQPGAKRNNRPLLIDTGALKRGVYAIPQTDMLIIWGNNIRYARIHNYGGTITQSARSEIFQRLRKKSGQFKKGKVAGKGFTFKQRTIIMPQRQFMGDAPFVRKRLILAAKNYLTKQFSI
jgi:phage gpG-like protein